MPNLQAFHHSCTLLSGEGFMGEVSPSGPTTQFPMEISSLCTEHSLSLSYGWAVPNVSPSWGLSGAFLGCGRCWKSSPGAGNAPLPAPTLLPMVILCGTRLAKLHG